MQIGFFFGVGSSGAAPVKVPLEGYSLAE